MDRIAIIVPVYKNRLSAAETYSLKCSLSMRHKGRVVIVCPQNFDSSLFIDSNDLMLEEVIFERFHDDYFVDTKGYNLLLMSFQFYQRFINYEFILISQLDALILCENVELWLDKDFDYVGAPWINQKGKTKGLIMGNGGLSLRKTKVFHDILIRSNWINLRFLRWYDPRNSILRICSLVTFALPIYCYSIVKSNYIGYFDFAKLKGYNEDIAFSKYLQKHSLKMPTRKEAAGFSFEEEPEICYKITNDSLPFGCHAWQKYDVDFWLRHIPKLKKVILD